MITPALIVAIAPHLGAAANRWADAFEAWLPEFEINTPARQRFFLAQAAHESAGFTRLEENLDYTAARLVQVFPKHFTPFEAADYAHKPVKIANRVYAGRGGNGDEASGDGWLFRGGGLFQLTFRANYANASRALYHDELALLRNPDLIRTDPDHAIATAVWYWISNDLNRFADANDLDGCRDLIWRGRKTAAEGDSAGFAQVLAYAKTLEQATA